MSRTTYVDYTTVITADTMNAVDQITYGTNALNATKFFFYPSWDTNSAAYVITRPSGSSTVSGFESRNTSDDTDYTKASFHALNTMLQIKYTANGNGSSLPITFYTDGGSGAEEVFRVHTSGRCGFGTAAAPHVSAKVEIKSTTQGFLPPRMTGTERDAISTPATGLMVYNTTTNKLNVYTGAGWEAITSA